ITLVFLAGLFFLTLTYRSFRHHSPNGALGIKNFHHRPLTVDNIEGWMTFGFINHSFNLPPEYLKNTLGITDNKYPNITLDRWAKESRAKSADLLEETKLLIGNRQKTSPNNSPSISPSSQKI
ncbi:MAG: hypothetical protein P4L58_03930, partial [Candidatus Pacebacteria bacterium]|nr:hypothetical protein [Candidatus Paceibacterota bacterium]